MYVSFLFFSTFFFFGFIFYSFLVPIEYLIGHLVKSETLATKDK